MIIGIPQPTQNVNVEKIAGLTLDASTPTTGQVTIGTSPTKIVNANDNRRTLIVVNNSGSSVYLGGNSVSTSNGLELPTGAVLNLERVLEGYRGALYGIVASGSATISYMEA